MTSPTVSLWLPAVAGSERALQSAELRELDDHDEISLFVSGELAAQFQVPKGLGSKVLGECGLVRQ